MALFNWLLRRDPQAPGVPASQKQSLRDLSSRYQATNTAERSTFGHAQTVPTGDFRFIALDVETACGAASSICQIGLACVAADNAIQTFSMLVDPDTHFDAFNVQLHGIGPEHVVGAPCFTEALSTLLPLLSKHHLIQHSSFDKRAIAAACQSCGIATPDLQWSDSVVIARRAWPELKGNGGHGLASLKRTLDLAFHHHDAGEDARAAALVVLHAEARLQVSFEELTQPASKKTYPAKTTRTPNPDGRFVGSVVVFTGNLTMSRDAAADMAAAMGLAVKSNVTQKTTYLVVGDQDLAVLAGHSKSSKHRKAEDLCKAGHAIEIIAETEFLGLMGS